MTCVHFKVWVGWVPCHIREYKREFQDQLFEISEMNLNKLVK